MLFVQSADPYQWRLCKMNWPLPNLKRICVVTGRRSGAGVFNQCWFDDHKWQCAWVATKCRKAGRLVYSEMSQKLWIWYKCDIYPKSCKIAIYTLTEGSNFPSVNLQDVSLQTLQLIPLWTTGVCYTRIKQMSENAVIKQPLCNITCCDRFLL